MDPVTVVNEFPLVAKLILYIGIPVVGGLVTALGILWKSKESAEVYIREQDKANTQILTNLSKMLEIIHLDITNLPDDVAKELSGVLNEIKSSLSKNA